jgi:DNA-binding MarR family transcriptional regulator
MQPLTTQQTDQETGARQGWSRLVRVHAGIGRSLDARLSAEHDLTINEYNCLLLLERAEECRMRRVDIAEAMVLSPSGITRMLDRLESAGLVEKAKCSSDARVTYAVLTDKGRSRLKAAGKSHDAVVEELVGVLPERDLKRLGEILERLGAKGNDTCSIADE